MPLLELTNLWPPFLSLQSGGGEQGEDTSLGGPPGHCDVGDVVRVFGRFVDVETQLAVDPDSVNFTVRNPCGELVSYTYGEGVRVQRRELGIYFVDVYLERAGTWHVRSWSTGTGQAATEIQLTAHRHAAM